MTSRSSRGRWSPKTHISLRGLSVFSGAGVDGLGWILAFCELRDRVCPVRVGWLEGDRRPTLEAYCNYLFGNLL